MDDKELLVMFRQLQERRRSVRAYLGKTITEGELKSIFTLAQQAPSNCNTQPWLVHVVSGVACDTLRQQHWQAAKKGSFTMDFPYDGVYEGVYKDRQYGAAAALYNVLGIEREDKDKRHKQFEENFRFFGAPHVVFMFIPESFGVREAVDIGIYCQNVMLSMAAHGVASCPQTSLGFCANLVREFLGIDASLKLLLGISFGYEDEQHAVNKCRTERAALDQSVKFY